MNSNLTGRTNNKLWEESKKKAIEKMGGLFSARAMQQAGKIYRDAGGGYSKQKTEAQKSLTKWTKEEWRTKSGLPSGLTHERYLPKAAIKELTGKEYAATSKEKLKGTLQGKQYVKQPKDIAEKTKKFRL
jgi:hypothetical protein